MKQKLARDIKSLKEDFNMIPNMSYNPQFGGYNQSFFNPYGMGGGMPNFGGGYPGMTIPMMKTPFQESNGGLNIYGDPIDTQYLGGTPLFNEATGTTRTLEEYRASKQNRGQRGGVPSFSGMQTGGGYPSMDMGMAPGSFMNNFQLQLKDMFNKYFNQGQVAIDPAVGPAPTAGNNTGTSTTLGSTATTPTTPDFGNLGGRFDRGKTLTNKANKKLNNMGYTNNQIVDARQAGGGKAGFQAALGGMQPGR